MIIDVVKTKTNMILFLEINTTHNKKFTLHNQFWKSFVNLIMRRIDFSLCKWISGYLLLQTCSVLHFYRYHTRNYPIKIKLSQSQFHIPVYKRIIFVYAQFVFISRPKNYPFLSIFVPQIRKF